VALPACEAVNVHVPVPLVIVTVLPNRVHTPDGVMVTVSPELALAEMVKLVL